MKTNYERRIEELEARMDRRAPIDSRTKAEVEAFIQEMFGQAIDLGPGATERARAEGSALPEPDPTDPTDPNAYDAADYTDEKINSCPERRRRAEVFGVMEWDGKRWERVEWEGAAKMAPYFTPLP